MDEQTLDISVASRIKRKEHILYLYYVKFWNKQRIADHLEFNFNYVCLVIRENYDYLDKRNKRKFMFRCKTEPYYENEMEYGTVVSSTPLHELISKFN